jgi:hypothetical protein
MTPDNEWSTIDTSQSQNKEEDKVEFEIEGQEEQEVVEAKPQQPKPEVQTKAETEEDIPEKKPEANSSGAEKRIRQLVRQKKEREEQIEQLISKQAELEERLKAQQKDAETSFTKSFETTEQQIKSRIEMAKDVYKQALESGDSGLIVNAQESLTNAQNDANALNIAKQQYELQKPNIPEAKETVAPTAQSKSNVKYDKLALDWAGKNPWFGQDQVMTTLALELDQTLKGEGYDPSEEDFYSEIDNRLRQQYPERFGVDNRQQETTSPAQVVGGASRTPSSSSKGKKVKLSKEDMRLAEKWGIPLEQYAAEKLKVEKSEGDYTTVYNK